MYGAQSGLAATAAPAAALPFTGFSVMWFVLAAVTLFTAGLALVRLARR
jgi:hypothetical protein